MNNTLRYAPDIDDSSQALKDHMIRVYGWMAAALSLTALSAWMVSGNQQLLALVIDNTFIFFALILLQLGIVWWLSSQIQSISTPVALVGFISYAVLNGLTLSFIFLIYTSASIFSTFAITAGTFAVMSVYGYTTKADLTSWGSLLWTGLIWIIIASLVNIFLASESLYWIITWAGVLVFVGLVAYDTQKIKEMFVADGQEESMIKKAILGALALYLDFINLFLMLLRLFGERK